MLRRQILLAGALLAPLVATAQRKARLWRIGWLGGTEEGGTIGVDIFREGMRALGYAEGHDYVLEVRWARGDPARARALAAELIGLNVDVLLTQGSEATRAAKQATSSVPIVFHGPSYPIEEGLVVSFARPGANVTGISVAMSDTVTKHLQLLRELHPTLADVAVVWSPANPGHTFAIRETERTGASMRMRVHSVPMEKASDVDATLAAIARIRPDALIVWASAGLAHVPKVQALAASLRLPSITNTRSLAEQGLLMAYGPDFRDTLRRIPNYVDRILKGTKPTDVPVERPTKFELVINMKTAKAIGFTIPSSLVLRADEIIQ